VACAALLALTLALYAPDLGTGWFRIDDEPYVPHNTRIQAVTLEHVATIATEPYFANYSPAHLYAYMLDWAFVGDDPRGFHLSSNVWAGLCAAWVYLLGWYLFRQRAVALAAGLLFVVHPAHVEAIAWISSRKDLVSTFFAVPCLIAYLEGRRRASRGWYLASIALFVAALAGKLSVVVLPGMFLLFDLLVERRKGWGVWLDKVPYGLVSIYFALRVMDAQPPPFRELDPVGLTAVLGQFGWLLTGLGEHVVFRPAPGAASGVSVVLPWIGVAAVLAVVPVLLARRASPRALALYLWILVALVPSQILRFAYPVSDRYLFYPSVPLVLLLAHLLYIRTTLGGAASAARRRIALVALVALGSTWAWKTCSYLAEWSDPRSLWYGASHKVEDVFVHQYLGEHYQIRAERLLAELRADAAPGPESTALIAALGFEDETLDVLQREWSRTVGRRPMTDRIVEELLTRAWSELEAADAFPDDRINAHLIYARARNLQLRGEHEAALAEFERAWNEAGRQEMDRVRWPYKALSSYGMATCVERRGDVERALGLMQRARREQARGGEPLLKNLEAEIARLRALVEG